MKTFVTNFFRFCPKTGRFLGLKKVSGLAKLFFPIAGIAAIVWILVRVLPKPSRAQYPCMKVAAPIASSFIIYVAGLAAAVFSFKKARVHFQNSSFGFAVTFLIAATIIGSISFLRSEKDYSAQPLMASDSLFVPSEPANSPMGTAKGIFPGRVVWMHDPDATSWDGKTGYWWNSQYTNQQVVDSMLAKSLRSLTGKSTDTEAWDAIFRYFNINHNKGDVGYTVGEKIAIKINLNQVSGTWNPGNSSFPSPQAVLALLRQLVNKAGVPAEDITFYDSNRYAPDAIYTKCKAEFPGVHFMGWMTLNGREKFIRDTTNIHWSKKFTMETIGTTPSGYPAYLPTAVMEASYIISQSLFKAHRYVGVTFCTKNHFGTISCSDGTGTPYQNAPHAAGLHPYVAVHDITIQGSPEWSFKGNKMGVYNALVDLMGHKDVGNKTLLFMIDALYGVEDEQHAVSSESKWQSAPFNNDWTSSIFLSLDNCAIESVGLDFYRTEQSINPKIEAVYGSVDNYLHESSQANNPPSGTFYAPNGDGTRLTSIGVHEHWNNATDKKYSRNLGTGNGIELVSLTDAMVDVRSEKEIPTGYVLNQNYPNPFNPSTTISYQIPESGFVSIKLYDALGKEVAGLVNKYQYAGYYTFNFNASKFTSGVYIYKMNVNKITLSKKMLLVK